jgi:hypothetical protein
MNYLVHATPVHPSLCLQYLILLFTIDTVTVFILLLMLLFHYCYHYKIVATDKPLRASLFPGAAKLTTHLSRLINILWLPLCRLNKLGFHFPRRLLRSPILVGQDQFTKNFRSIYKRPASIEKVKSCMQKSGETLRSYIQRWSIIKNLAENVFDERAVDAFAFGLHRSDLIEELGRIKPRTVSELMEVANRFVDREDAYHSKRARSPKHDRLSRQHNQRRRSRNEDGRTPRTNSRRIHEKRQRRR